MEHASTEGAQRAENPCMHGFDPNEALRELRHLIEINGEEDYSEEIAEKFQALDEWLSKGGFLPEDWRLAPPEEHYEHTH